MKKALLAAAALLAAGAIAAPTSAQARSLSGSLVVMPETRIADLDNGIDIGLNVNMTSQIDVRGHADFLVLGLPADDLLEMGERLGMFIDGDNTKIAKMNLLDTTFLTPPNIGLGEQTKVFTAYNNIARQVGIDGEIATSAQSTQKDEVLGVDGIILVNTNVPEDWLGDAGLAGMMTMNRLNNTGQARILDA